MKVIDISGKIKKYFLFCYFNVLNTYANDIGIQYYVIKQLVNHASGKTSDVTFDYIAINIDTLRTHVKKIESYILQNAGIKQEAEVIPFPKTGEV